MDNQLLWSCGLHSVGQVRVVPIVALSGGADSMLAAYICSELHETKPELVAPPVYFHMDHDLRPKSRSQAQEIAGFAEKKAGLFISTRINVKRQIFKQKSVQRFCLRSPQSSLLKQHPDYFAEPSFFCFRQKISKRTAQKSGSASALEERGSLWRWFFLEWMAAFFENPVIVTGHNLSDWYESYLMGLLRGASPGGPKQNRANHWLPLATKTKAEVLEEKQTLQLPVWSDETNQDRSILRNRIRQDWATETAPGDELRRSYELHQEITTELNSKLFAELEQAAGDWPYLPTVEKKGSIGAVLDRATKIQLQLLARKLENNIMVPDLKSLERLWANPFRLGLLRAELSYVFLAKRSDTELKLWLNAILNTWGLPPLGRAVFTEFCARLAKAQTGYVKPMEFELFQIGFVGGNTQNGYLVLRPKALPYFCLPAQARSNPKEIRYSKHLKVKQGNVHKKLASICQENRVSEIDRPFLELVGDSENGIKAIKCQHIRRVWHDLA